MNILLLLIPLAAALSPHMQLRRLEYALKTKEMFSSSLEAYLEHAFPADELSPIACSKHSQNPFGSSALTLIDALDTSIIMNNQHAFFAAVHLIKHRFPASSPLPDTTVSVFETNIRIVGGLLSAHIAAARSKFMTNAYDGSLLPIAIRFADALMPAFDTPTGIPYGSIHLRHGVAANESTVVCTACATTFSIEFAWLSILSGNPIYERAARRAVRGIWSRRSEIDLVASHIDVVSGAWIYPDASIAGDSDSFLEYLFKSYMAFSDEIEYGAIFRKAYRAVRIYMRRPVPSFSSSSSPAYYDDVHFRYASTLRSSIWSLASFWPAVRILAGDVSEAIDDLIFPATILNRLPFLPEAIQIYAKQVSNSDQQSATESETEFTTESAAESTTQSTSKPSKSNSSTISDQKTTTDPLSSFTMAITRPEYPLRPEYIESLWYLYKVTHDDTILLFIFDFIDRLNTLSRTSSSSSQPTNPSQSCYGGFANIENVLTLSKQDKMESFFLAETLKYVYLILDEHNEINTGNYVMNTEAHPFPIVSSYKGGWRSVRYGSTRKSQTPLKPSMDTEYVLTDVDDWVSLSETSVLDEFAQSHAAMTPSAALIGLDHGLGRNGLMAQSTRRSKRMRSGSGVCLVSDYKQALTKMRLHWPHNTCRVY